MEYRAQLPGEDDLLRVAAAVEQRDPAPIRRLGQPSDAAAMILFLAFLALASSPGTDIKVFATALGIGILLDATVVRAILVPATMKLLGKWNWYMPERVRRALRLTPAPSR